jgi:site-specific recombinase XerD
MAKWKKTNHPGVRFREHPNRKHGVKMDRYFCIRYQRDGKRHEEGLGWSSEGWTAEKAAVELSELKKNYLLATGKPTTLQEKRKFERERQERERVEKARLKKESLTFGQYFEKIYYPIAQTSKKPESHKKENQHFKLWIHPILGNLPLKEITAFAIEKVKKKLLDTGKSPRSIQYVLATIRQVWNQARRDRFVMGDSPTKQVKIPKFDNQRQRFLTHAEADTLLENLQLRDFKVYQMALLSLHCGLRAGEIFSLRWQDIDTSRGLILIADPKGGHTRTAFMTEGVKNIFLGMNRQGPDELVFRNKKGQKFDEMSKIFKATVDSLGLNKGISDRRQRVCFHTLRHSFASWHVIGGTDLYLVKKLLGHGSIGMTERYSHLSQGALQNSVKGFERAIEQAKQEKNKVIEMRKTE